MVMAADLSMRLGKIQAPEVQRLKQLIQAMGLPTEAPKLGLERYLELMQLDKKTAGGQIRYVVLDPLGAAIIETAPETLVKETLLATGAA
jgi:3-dehydroquinate synthase